ncbi:MAG TPA: aldose 1-epimerase family protein [Pseudolysinimonas sp.]|nr:aldose 1-epimerase family protein [Pseudolysinimonas sp.]
MHISLTAGDVRAEVGTVAAELRSIEVGGAALTEPRLDDGLPPFCNGIVLAPWPNRVRDAKWMHDATVQQLDITEPERGGALHGLLQFTDYELVSRADDAVTLGAFIAPQHGWPFALETTVTYALTQDGIRITHGATNVGAGRAPFAVGTHPFLRVGDTPVEQLTLTAPAATYFEVDERLNPTAESPVEGTLTDLRYGPVVGSLLLDTAYGSLAHANPADGHGDSAWLEAPDGARTTLWQDLDWGYLQVFTTPEFPRADGPGFAVAIEPMTAPPDALNSGAGLIWLEPGQTWQGSWGLRYSGPRG